MNTDLMSVMQNALRIASESLIEDFSHLENLNVTKKAPGDFVSQADIKAEKLIIDCLRSYDAGIGFYAEEGTHSFQPETSQRWIIDPLDGTMNFIRGMNNWCITIALEKENEIVAGATLVPLVNEFFYAEKNCGAFLNGKQIFVSKRDELIDCFVHVDSGDSRKDEKRFDLFNTVVLLSEVNTAGVLINGSAALDLCYLAAGRLDVMFHCGGAKPWDVAAGFLLVQEAGGVIKDMNAEDATHMTDQFVASVPKLYEEFSEMLGL
jgi:myo-inositol-1(or 4)-monophosphatase